MPSLCPALQSIALRIRSECALTKNRFAWNEACRQRMSLWAALTPASRVAHLGNAFVLFLLGWVHSSFGIIYAGRGETSDAQFLIFVGKNLRFVGLVSGTNSGTVLDPRGPKRGPFSGPEHGPRKSMVEVCHC